MADINIFRKNIRGQARLHMVPETEAGRKYLKDNYVSTSELVDIQGDTSDLEDIINKIYSADLTVEVYNRG
jgi:hypothetical protein